MWMTTIPPLKFFLNLKHNSLPFFESGHTEGHLSSLKFKTRRFRRTSAKSEYLNVFYIISLYEMTLYHHRPQLPSVLFSLIIFLLQNLT